jgi:predicted membrane GTPase involved in stress response
MIIKFNIPSRGIIGYVISYLQLSLGTWRSNYGASICIGYEPFKGEIAGRNKVL